MCVLHFSFCSRTISIIFVYIAIRIMTSNASSAQNDDYNDTDAAVCRVHHSHQWHYTLSVG